MSVSGTFVPKGLENKYLFLNFTENKHGMLKYGLGFWAMVFHSQNLM